MRMQEKLLKYIFELATIWSRIEAKKGGTKLVSEYIY